MRPRQITFVPHTHWDREWYEPFETLRAQLIGVIDRALIALEKEPSLHFTLDGQMALVDDYLELRPQNEARLRALVAEGRVHIGPFYTQADTLLTPGEGVIRNLAHGIARAESLGGATRVGYMADQFGHAAQMPQLFALFGIEHAALWRGVGPERPTHAFAWLAPDGSRVTTVWLQDGYASGRRIPSDPAHFVTAITQHFQRLDEWLGSSPALVPVGDDHVPLSAWLPEAVRALAVAQPALETKLEIGGFTKFFAGVKGPMRTIEGELRSPAFAPVLAGVASARGREKQAGHRAMQQLLSYAEPLSAWVAKLGGEAPTHLIDKAWRQLILNQAHDSAAGCGADVMHDDVQARYRWAEQLAVSAQEIALAELTVARRDGLDALVFSPVAHPRLQVTTEIPRSLKGSLVAIGPDGARWPIQMLGATDTPPVFEGEFAATELAQYLGNLDPATPIFGKFLVGLTAREEGQTTTLDVGLGSEPGAPGRLAADQAKLFELLARTERFKVVMHDAAPTTTALIQAGPAIDAGLLPIAIEAGEPDADLPRACALDDGRIGIATGALTVVVQPDGSVVVDDGKRSMRANDLVDDRDRGDLYHNDPIGPTVVSSWSSAIVVERGPLRARLRIEQVLDVPAGLLADRKASLPGKPLQVTTEITVTAGERRVDFVTTFINTHEDHRLRAQAHVPYPAERFDVEHGLAVVARPFDPKTSLGAGAERAAATGQHHLFVDLGANDDGLALMSRGLFEHEALRAATGTTLSLTLLRSVGWLSRGDLTVIDHAAGPMIPTPNAQEPGAHRVEYALLLHDGDWQAGGVMAEARAYAAPPLVVHARGSKLVPAATPLVDVSPAQVTITALEPSAGGVRVRVLNASSSPTIATLALAGGAKQAQVVDPLGRALTSLAVELRDGIASLGLRPWQIATVVLA
jgi:mannosylglycerate hydrolase